MPIVLESCQAWGFYCRHAEGVKFKNITLQVQGKDYRPALVCDDVKDLELDRFRVESAGSEPVIVLNRCERGAYYEHHPSFGGPCLRQDDGCNAGGQGPLALRQTFPAGGQARRERDAPL